MGSAISLTDYEIGERLGQGAFGIVFKVKKDGKIFALKEMRDHDETALVEIEVLKKVEYEYIIRYYNSFPSRGCLYIVMEFADKGMMSSYVEKQDAASSVWKNVLGAEFGVWRILAHIALALRYLHTVKPKPILHRDLKPDNILGVTGYSEIAKGNRTHWKLADFGIAKLLNPGSQSKFYTSTVIGTPIYMAPEVLRGEQYSFPADMWSLGVVMSFWCNVGVHLFLGEHLGRIFQWKGEASGLPGHYSFDLCCLNRKLLDPNPKKRPTAAEVVAECTSERQEAGRHVDPD